MSLYTPPDPELPQNSSALAISGLPRKALIAFTTSQTAIMSVAGVAIYLSLMTNAGEHGVVVATMVAVGAAALISGIAGFAFSAICGAMVFQFRHDAVEVVQTMLLCSLANQALSVCLLRQQISLRAMMPAAIGGVIGVPAGVFLLLHLSPRNYELGLGLLLTVYGLYMLSRPPLKIRSHGSIGDVVAGFIGGVMGGFAATPGAPVAIWSGTKGWDKMRQRALVQPYIVVAQIVGLIAIALMKAPGAVSLAVPPSAWVCVPVGLAGTAWGFHVGSRITDKQFGIVVNLLLIVSGLGLLF